MRTLILVAGVLISGCTSTSNSFNDEFLKRFEVTGHYANHCGGIDIPVCKYWVEGVEKDRSREHTMKTINLLGSEILKSLLTGR
jgi:hypothetical protein